jgi:hypothetical protein
VPHETPSGRVSPSHPIMITKGNNIAGEVAYLSGSPLGMLGGSPLRSASQRQSSILYLPSARRCLSSRDGDGVTSISSSIAAARDEWDTNTYYQAVNPLHGRARGFRLIRIMMHPSEVRAPEDSATLRLATFETIVTVFPDFKMRTL